MTIWSFKGGAAALSLTLFAGCDGGLNGAFARVSLLDPSILSRATGGKDVALSKARMAFGTVTLVAPQGFCIDKSSLKQSFAVMARCDTLGVPSAAGSAPLALITASFVPMTQGAALPSPAQTASALNLAEISDETLKENSVIFRASSPTPYADMQSIHWRATARVGDQIMGLALYSSEDTRDLSTEGRAILGNVIATTTPAS